MTQMVQMFADKINNLNLRCFALAELYLNNLMLFRLAHLGVIYLGLVQGLAEYFQ